MKYKLYLYQLPNIKDDIMNYKIDSISSKYQSHSLFKYGHIAYVNDTRNNYIKLLDDPRYKEKTFYHVVHEFNDKVRDYEDDIENTSKKYFELSNINKNFYKIWELLMMFDLVNKDIVCANITHDGMSSLAIQKYCDFNGNKQNIFQISMNKLNTKDVSSFKNNDIINIKTIKSYRKEFKNKFANLVIADADFEVFDYNYKEQFAYKLILSEILYSINVQEKGGNLVLKVFGIFTNFTIKLLCILSSFYEFIYIYKPLTSNKSDSEKYVIAYGFKYKQDDKLQKKIKPLEDLLDKKDHLNDIFTNYQLSLDLISVIKYLNVKLSNEEFNEVNKIMTFIKGGNYFGDKYHNYHDNQIEASKYWIENFLPAKKDFKKQQNKLSVLLKNSDDENKKLINDFYNRFI